MNRVDNASLKTSKPWLPLDDCASLSRCCLRVVFEGASLSLDNIEDFAGVTEGNQFQSLPEKKRRSRTPLSPCGKQKFQEKGPSTAQRLPIPIPFNIHLPIFVFSNGFFHEILRH
jgi:hypothetical protein